jgi:tRNA pseudouridine55 synthase
MIDGILNVYKPKGYTSHDVVAKTRRILKEKKIGHTGTLDPNAQGVLPLCIGQGTKIVPYLTDADKCYEAEVILGANTTTEDDTGEIIEAFPVDVTKEQVEKVVQSFIGEYEQTPPMYSAIKINGVRLYELARAGIVIERPSRKVSIHQIELLEWKNETVFKIRVYCSKGTYIRTLCTDIGRSLGTGAHMGELLRTRVGNFYIQDSISLEELEENPSDGLKRLIKVEDFFCELSKGIVRQEAASLLYNGNTLRLEQVELKQSPKEAELVRLYNRESQFVAVYKMSDGCLKVEKMFYRR